MQLPPLPHYNFENDIFLIVENNKSSERVGDGASGCGSRIDYINLALLLTLLLAVISVVIYRLVHFILFRQVAVNVKHAEYVEAKNLICKRFGSDPQAAALSQIEKYEADMEELETNWFFWSRRQQAKWLQPIKEEVERVELRKNETDFKKQVAERRAKLMSGSSNSLAVDELERKQYRKFENDFKKKIDARRALLTNGNNTPTAPFASNNPTASNTMRIGGAIINDFKKI